MRNLFTKLTLVLGVLLGVLAVAPRSEAQYVGRRYPNATYGPWYMEVRANILAPNNGSKWAFGMLTLCSVPHQSSHYFYASTINPAQYATDSYYRSANFGSWYPGGIYHPIDSSVTSYWRPSGTGASWAVYLPPIQTWVTTPPGTCYAEAISALTSLSTYLGVSMTDDNLFICCENGEGC
jgi:hypothetical protein